MNRSRCPRGKSSIGSVLRPATAIVLAACSPRPLPNTPQPLPAPPAAFHATVSPIAGALLERIHGSWHAGCPVDVQHLRAVTADHVTFAGTIETGTVIVHEDAADAVRAVLEKLFLARYPIAKMEPIDAFEGDDDRSMTANN